jgi:uncharacterized protein YneF (UPF0154 family)
MKTIILILVCLLIFVSGILSGMFLKDCDKDARKSIDIENKFNGN